MSVNIDSSALAPINVNKNHFCRHIPISQGFVVILNSIPSLIMSEAITDENISSPFFLLR